MSFFFGDGFDLYALPGDAAAGHWDSTPNFSGCSLQPGRFSGSRAMNMSGVPSGTKTSGVNDAVHHFTFAYMQTSNTTSSNTGFYITLFDGTTAQCTVGIRGDGLIMLMSGTQTGTVLATYAGPPAIANVWTAYEIELVVHNTNGSMTIRKNGNINNDYYSGLFNTRNSANNYANKMSFGYYNTIGASIYIDDFLWRSDVSTVLWSGDVRCYTRRPASDVVAQFSRTTAPINTVMWNGVNVTQSFGTGSSAYYLVTVPYSGLLTGVTLQAGNSASTGHIKVALFSNINNTVGSVLAIAAELTLSSSTPGVGHTLTFPTPAYVTAGQTYWIGLAVDTTTINVNVVNNPTTVASVAMAYATFPISNPGAVVGSFNASGLALIFTPQSNADSVAELYQDQTTNYVYSSVNGQNDLYAISSISPAAPFQVFGVVTRGYFEKSDSGTRNATVQLKSGGVTVQGPDTALGTVTWNWVSRIDVTDPATGVAWTPTAVNSVTIGPRVTA